MDTECGTPAFDNIDDLLASRIVNRSRSNTDRTDMQQPDDLPPSGTPEQSPQRDEQTGHPAARVLIIAAAIVTVLLFINYLIRHLSRR
jgi:hypothetical protein